MHRFSEENPPCFLCDETRRTTNSISRDFSSPIPHDSYYGPNDDDSHLSLAPLIRERGFSLEQVQQQCLNEFKNDEETVHIIMLATLRDLDRGLEQGEMLHMPQDMHVSAPGRNTLTIVEYSFHEGKNKESNLISSSLVHHQHTDDEMVEVEENVNKRRLTQVDDERPAKRARQSPAFPPTMSDAAHSGQMHVQHYDPTQCGLPPPPFISRGSHFPITFKFKFVDDSVFKSFSAK